MGMASRHLTGKLGLPREELFTKEKERPLLETSSQIFNYCTVPQLPFSLCEGGGVGDFSGRVSEKGEKPLWNGQIMKGLESITPLKKRGNKGKRGSPSC